MSNNFYNLKKTLDKKKDSSTHKSQYFGSIKNFNLSSNDIDKFKDSFNKKEDKDALNEISDSLKKNNKLPFAWTHHESFYLDNCKTLNDKINYLIYRYKFKIYPEKRTLSEFPIHVLLEPTSICNLRCVMCYQMDKKFTGDDIKKNGNTKMMGKMSFDLFKKVIDECAKEGAGAISIGSRGEPMINKDFVEMLNYIKKKNFYDVKINSNGLALTEKVCHGILQSSVNILVISCDANTPELYKKIRVGGDFNKLLKNIKLLTDIRNKHYKDSKLEIRISGVYFHPEQNQDDFFNFWNKKVDTVSFVKVQNRWDTYNNPINEKKNNPCDFLWEKIYVWWDGTTNPCDEDYMSVLSPGNASTMTIKELWNGEKLNSLRKLHLNNGRITKNPCDRCNV